MLKGRIRDECFFSIEERRNGRVLVVIYTPFVNGVKAPPHIYWLDNQAVVESAEIPKDQAVAWLEEHQDW